MFRHSSIRRFWADETGATAIEYALICAIIATALITIAQTGGALTVVYSKLNKVVDALVGSSGGDSTDSSSGT